MATLPESKSNQVSNDEITGENVESGDLENGSNGIPIYTKETLTGVNIYRYLATLLSFVVMGMNDAAYGALIPYLEEYYNITYTIVSLVFLAPFLGYTLAALLNNQIHMRFGQLGVAVIAPLCKLITYAVTCAHPAYPALPVIFMISGFGNGLEDSGWNAWIGDMQNANELLGFLHGAYGLGATISPLIATAMVTRDIPWYAFYYVMVGITVLELVVCVISFWKATGAVHRAANPPPKCQEGHSQSQTKEALKNYVTWILAFFLLIYVGVEVALGGWLVTFMLRVRHGEAFASGLVVMGFWLGITVGRMILGFVTGRIGEKLAIAAYIFISVACELCFWLIPNFVSSAIFAGFLGFFLGPLFPAAIVVATKVLPKRLHVSAIGFAAAFGGGGAAIFPFVVGAIAQVKGVQVLQPIALALIAVIFMLWCSLPGGFKKDGLKKVEDKREMEDERLRQEAREEERSTVMAETPTEETKTE
ncbi:MFS general substrate transporter [Venustampulla echinocandica]|uniref:MFS general substrate transporter n=1 Tax=Venustampulla echinocandica TaxID=2656787 RepID=A0A370TPA9_9HELO|nr:MFS general substrate transporter [Venustampulla echinocandica]RDL37361.1 MFS general substrate transporter [Venustampulla echinocandica]